VDTTLQDALVGQVVDGRYHVESLIARGGMATVYLALDRRLERDVALKVMRDDLAGDPEFVSRLVREARAAARLTSPHVVQVYDQGADGPWLYLAMEYLPGRTMRDVLQQRAAFTLRETFSVMEPVLEALAAAHRAGIVHRDVKPENVVLTDDGRIKVADFGLARAAAVPITGGGPDARLLGTAAYLAPELVSRGVADARADVYAVGVMLFETLTGRPPYADPDPVRLAYRHVHERVPAPSLVVPGLPNALDELVLAATAHDPDLRPSDGERMLAELRELRRTLPDDVLDVRAIAPPAGATTVVAAAPAQQQQTRALNIPRRASAAVPQLVPRLRVHEDDGVVHEGFMGGDRRRQTQAIIAGALALTLVLVTLGWWFAAGPGAKTTVPGGLTGQRVADAQRLLAADGLRGTPKEVFNDTIAKGQVVGTDPPSGESIAKDGTVVLLVSKGPEQVAVPALQGTTPENAERQLREAGLKLGKRETRFSDDVEKGKIISTQPQGDTLIAPGRTVDIVVSKGVEQVEVPNLVGASRDDAVRQLQERGLDVEVTETPFQFGGPFPRTVTAQDPQPTTKIPKGEKVTLTVVGEFFGGNNGGGNNGGNNGQVQVPEVRGQQVDAAENTLRQQGFDVRRDGDGDGDDIVSDQNPAPGTFVPFRSQITIRA
jgi:beta-lactam-binding protein with PASTA domain